MSGGISFHFTFLIVQEGEILGDRIAEAEAEVEIAAVGLDVNRNTWQRSLVIFLDLSEVFRYIRRYPWNWTPFDIR
jgi:hypothetical protein